MTNSARSRFQQEVVEALLESKAIDLTAVGATLSKFGERAAREGETLVSIINRNVMWNCGNPGPILDVVRVPVVLAPAVEEQLR